MGDSSDVALVGAMERNPALTELNLYGSNIDGLSAAVLAETFEKN